MNNIKYAYEYVTIHSVDADMGEQYLTQQLDDGFEILRADATATSVHYVLRKEAELLATGATSVEAAKNDDAGVLDDSKIDRENAPPAPTTPSIDDKPIDLSEIPF